jgi:WD40 repeat protein
MLVQVMFPHGYQRVAALAYHPRRPLVCTAGQDCNLKLWSMSGSDALSLPPGVKPSEDGADSQHWTCAAVRTFRPTACRAAAFSCDGAVVAASYGAAVVLCSAESLARLAVLTHPLVSDCILSLSFLVASPTLVAASTDAVIVWDLRTSRVKYALNGK